MMNLALRIALIAASVLGLCGRSLSQQSFPCDGCVGSHNPGVQPVQVTWWDTLHVDLLGTAGITVDVTDASGICTFQPSTTNPWHWFCSQLLACEPTVEIALHLDDDYWASDLDWKIVASGTICNAGHVQSAFSAEGDAVLLVFAGKLSLPCGTLDCEIDTSYEITLWQWALPSDYCWGTRTLQGYGDVTCTACDRAVMPTPF